jgi:hypothetical protein
MMLTRVDRYWNDKGEKLRRARLLETVHLQYASTAANAILVPKYLPKLVSTMLCF